MSAHDREPRGLITRADELDFDPRSTAHRPRETRVLLADPEYYAVEYVINPHMAANVGAVDTGRARSQWEALREAYRGLGFEVHVLPAVPGMPDLVFTANQSFPTLFVGGRWGAVLSHLKHDEREGEVAIFAAWYDQAGARTLELEGTKAPFEGMGDALWLPGHRLVLGGYGFRTDPEAYAHLADLLEVPVLALALVDEHFYHLDTCLSLIDSGTALYVPDAFDAESITMLEKTFPCLIALPADESVDLLACNGHCPDERHFLVQSGCERTVGIVRDLGLEVIELDTSEYLKSGGSVFCMKLMLP
ncbi:MAG: dimethylarginine dimethylaminohydrolase family protein [Planctomycetota bacterium]|jgi:N-dimethylarginine dimethylaminohydrolase